MIKVNQIKLRPGHSDKDLEQAVLNKLKLNTGTKLSIKIVKKSIDSRKKPDIYYIYSVEVTVNNNSGKISETISEKEESKIVAKAKSNDVMLSKDKGYEDIAINEKLPKLSHRPVIVGLGPAGLMCGLMLARKGYRPVIYERGKDVERRIKDVEKFWKEGILNTESNVSFGEGGAGTFSDGKLNTMIKDPSGRIKYVLEILHEFGAEEEILYINKPHIGTDVLHRVVANIRNEIIRLGGEVNFDSCVTDIDIEEGRLKGVVINGKDKVNCEVAVFGIGHSARNTFEMLYEKGIVMQPKAYALGLRIEHPQSMIDYNAYGDCIYELPPADYKVTYQTSKERGVYSFCMCPGGYVVNASTEEGRTCVNGMSYSKRDSKNANSALIVTVTPEDYKGSEENPLMGMYFQRKLEEAAYKSGEGKIPMQTFGAFADNKVDESIGQIEPVTKGAVKLANLRQVLPEFISESIIEAMGGFANNIEGFDRRDALLFAVESRTSSPVRIVRNDECMSNIYGLMPCGEGAGYAGGITSAAVDGIKVYEKIISQYSGVKEI